MFISGEKRPQRIRLRGRGVNEAEPGHTQPRVVAREPGTQLRQQVLDRATPRSRCDLKLEHAPPYRHGRCAPRDRRTRHVAPRRLQLEVLGARRGEPQRARPAGTQRFKAAGSTCTAHVVDCRRNKDAGPRRRRGPPGRGATFPGRGVDLVDIPARPEAPDRSATSLPGNRRDWGRPKGLQARGHARRATPFRRVALPGPGPSGFSAPAAPRPIDELVIRVTIPSGAALYNERRRSRTP